MFQVLWDKLLLVEVQEVQVQVLQQQKMEVQVVEVILMFPVVEQKAQEMFLQLVRHKVMMVQFHVAPRQVVHLIDTVVVVVEQEQ